MTVASEDTKTKPFRCGGRRDFAVAYSGDYVSIIDLEGCKDKWNLGQPITCHLADDLGHVFGTNAGNVLVWEKYQPPQYHSVTAASITALARLGEKGNKALYVGDKLGAVANIRGATVTRGERLSGSIHGFVEGKPGTIWAGTVSIKKDGRIVGNYGCLDENCRQLGDRQKSELHQVEKIRLWLVREGKAIEPWSQEMWQMISCEVTLFTNTRPADTAPKCFTKKEETPTTHALHVSVDRRWLALGYEDKPLEIITFDASGQPIPNTVCPTKVCRTNEEHATTHLSASHGGQYLACATKNRLVRIWNTDKEKPSVVAAYRSDGLVTDLAWLEPSQLAVGQIGNVLRLDWENQSPPSHKELLDETRQI